MPMYEYQCQSCKRTLEKRQKFSDAPLTECPHCGGHLEKLISAPAVQFKGGGWYADLYSSSSKGKNKSESSSDSSSATSASGEGSKSSSSSSDSSAASSAPASTTAASTASSGSSK